MGIRGGGSSLKLTLPRKKKRECTLSPKKMGRTTIPQDHRQEKQVAKKGGVLVRGMFRYHKKRKSRITSKKKKINYRTKAGGKRRRATSS